MSVSIFVRTSGTPQDHCHDRLMQVPKLSSISMALLITPEKALYAKR